MLQLLVQEKTFKKNEVLREKTPPVPSDKPAAERGNLPDTNTEIDLRKKLSKRTRDLKYVLEKVSVTRSSFGVPHFRLNISR